MPMQEVMVTYSAILNIRLQSRRKLITETLSLQVEKAMVLIIQPGVLPTGRLQAHALAGLRVRPRQLDLLHHPDHISQVV